MTPEIDTWDLPFFKRLPKNDTGQAPGHVGGMVIPMELRPYFPELSGSVSRNQPTIDQRITALLIVDGQFIGKVDTRYQMQTWGGERTPETRLTDNLSALRNRAEAGDYLLFQKSLTNEGTYKLTLVTKKSSEYSVVDQMAQGRRWGVLGSESPVEEAEIKRAIAEENRKEQGPFSLFDPKAQTQESRSLKIARSQAFTRKVVEIYDRKCCICRSGMISPSGTVEVQAAHIVPRHLKGSDDARNGLALCPTHHWTFDQGMIGIDASRKILIPPRVLEITENQHMKSLHGRDLMEANVSSLIASPEALRWHMDHVVRGG